MLLVKGGFLRGIIMNNDEFKQHFIKILSDLGVTDYNTKLFVVEPCVESGKGYNAKDDIMRLGVFPRTRELGYEEFIKTCTFWEGNYPCWIDVLKVDNEKVYLRTSLRLRKVPKDKNTDTVPFRDKTNIDNR